MNAGSDYYLHEKGARWKNRIAMAILVFGLGGILWSVFFYPGMFASSASFEDKNRLSLGDPLLVKFSGAMIPQTFDGKISVFPQADLRLKWQNHNRELVIYPAKDWKPETKYRISINGARNIVLAKLNFDFVFQTNNYPQVESLFPAEGARDVELDIEDPIVVNFKESLDDFWIKIAADAPMDLENQFDLEKNKMLIIPKKELEKGKKYSFSVLARGKNESDESYRNIFNFSFETKPDPPKIWEKDFALRLDQAKKYTEIRFTEGKYIDINVKSQVMTIFENGQALDAYIISSGKRGMDTPQGTFSIANKFLRAWSKKYGLFMPFWMAIVPSGDFGIHELPEWPSGYKEGVNHLGTPVSHGCVRLGVGAAERVYNWAVIGTPVVVHS